MRRITNRSWPAGAGRVLARARREFGAPLALLLGAVLLQVLAAVSPELVESFYARPVYPRVVGALSFVSRRFGFSVAEALLYVLLVSSLAVAVRAAVVLYARGEGRLACALAYGRAALWCAGACLWAFMLSFGLNYQRPLLYERLGFEQRRASAAELEAIGGEVVSGINSSYEEAHAPGRVAPGAEEVVRILAETFPVVPELSPLPTGAYAPPKPVYASEVMTRFGVSGVYSPFTAEPNYNADVPDFQMPFTMAHEMAHQRGVARESEANFVAFLVCVNSRDAFVRYSGYRNGLGVLGELYQSEPEKARALARQLGAGYREDSKRAALFWAKAGGTAGALGQRINDLYLRANRVRRGAADYAGSTTLIIGYYLRRMNRGPVQETR